jgi:hypothetical protein
MGGFSLRLLRSHFFSFKRGCGRRVPGLDSFMLGQLRRTRVRALIHINAAPRKKGHLFQESSTRTARNRANLSGRADAHSEVALEVLFSWRTRFAKNSCGPSRRFAIVRLPIRRHHHGADEKLSEIKWLSFEGAAKYCGEAKMKLTNIAKRCIISLLCC